jgi:hypothetical protein
VNYLPALSAIRGRDAGAAEQRPTRLLRRQRVGAHHRPYPGATNGDYDTYIKQSWFQGCFANGLPAAEAAELAADQRQTARPARSPSHPHPGLEDDSVLGPHRHRRPGARPGRAALHGQPRPRPHHRDQGAAPVDAVRPGRSHQRRPRGRPRHHLTRRNAK